MEEAIEKVKDQKLNIWILTNRVSVIKRICGEDDNKMYLCYDETPELKDIIRKWRQNGPCPVKDIRDVFAAEEIYYSNLHAHLDEQKDRRK